MHWNRAGAEAARGADALVRDHFAVQAGEQVVVTADTHSDSSAVSAVLDAACAAGARPALITIPQLPFQGTLADPFITDSVANAVRHSDVWFDLTFPYMAGSSVHDHALKEKRTRYLLLGDISGDGLFRLFASVSLDRLFEVQGGFDQFMSTQKSAACRITSTSGTDVSFRLGAPPTAKRRVVNDPGGYTPPGAGIFYPDPNSVRGSVFVDAMFHEYYQPLAKAVELVVDGSIREVRSIGPQTQAIDRALRRASNGEYGRVIHFTYGLHPAACFGGRSFIEDIRAVGTNAVGLGQPWWEPGGGENHPDAVLASQSLWVDGEQVVRDGVLVAPATLAERARALNAQPW